MISDVPQHDDVELSASVSNDTIVGSSTDGVRDSAQTVSHSKQEVALKASDSPMIGSSESAKHQWNSNCRTMFLHRILRFQRDGYSWIFVEEPPGLFQLQP